MSNSSIIHFFRACASMHANALSARLLFASISLYAMAILSGCTTTAAQINTRIPTKGNFVNGRDSIHGDDFAFIMTRDRGVTVTEIDGKPFFIEYKSPVIWDRFKWVKVASPINLQPSAALVIRPGEHIINMHLQTLEMGLLVNRVVFSKGEPGVLFIAEKGHGYIIKPNLTKDEKGQRVWRPTITDMDSNVTLRAK